MNFYLFVLIGKIFGRMVFIYWVVQFRSNGPVSCKTERDLKNYSNFSQFSFILFLWFHNCEQFQYFLTITTILTSSTLGAAWHGMDVILPTTLPQPVEHFLKQYLLSNFNKKNLATRAIFRHSICHRLVIPYIRGGHTFCVMGRKMASKTWQAQICAKNCLVGKV